MLVDCKWVSGNRGPGQNQDDGESSGHLALTEVLEEKGPGAW